MVKKGDPKVLRLVVKFLRNWTGMTQDDFGRASRVDQGNLSQYELGRHPAPEESLHRMADAAGIPWPVVVNLRRFYAAALSLAGRAGAHVALAETAEIEQTILDAVLLAITPYLVERWTERPSAEEALREAEEIWAALETFLPDRRRRLIELSPRPEGNAALARTICEASACAAADSVEEARELADLALFTALRVPGREGRRDRAVGFCRAFVANAERVATEFAAAEAELQEALALWKAGEPSDPDFFPEWRLYDLEASLRREQRRFPEALQCLDRAFALCAGEPKAAGHILLKKENVYDAMGDIQGALAALEEAAPYVEAAGDPHLLLRLRFNTADDLCALKRYADAAERLPAVRALASALGNELDLLRVSWLAAKVDAGQGRKEEAGAGLEQVVAEFRRLALPYEAALSALDLATLYLKEGRTAEVQQLAVAMGWIFSAKGIAREALAALSLFCEAAEQAAATVELAQRVSAELEKAQGSPPPFPGAG
jgi:tetratricopeptide (TPR) repeat protein